MFRGVGARSPVAKAPPSFLKVRFIQDCEGECVKIRTLPQLNLPSLGLRKFALHSAHPTVGGRRI